MGPYILPTFRGYKVDLREREFKRVLPDCRVEFIPFHAPEGEKLFEELESFAEDVIDCHKYE